MQPSSQSILVAVVWLAVAVAFAAVWVIALFDLVQRKAWEFPERDFANNPRLIWSVIVVLFGGIGGAIYYVRVMKPYPRGWRG